MNKLQINKLLLLITFLSIIVTSFLYYKVLFPFFLGVFIAYILDPLVDWLENKKIKRYLATTVILITFFGVMFLVSILIIPILIQQTLDFLEKFPSLVEKVENYISQITGFLNKSFTELNHVDIIKSLHTSLGLILKNFVNKLFLSSLAIFNYLSIVIITPVVAWYCLNDWDRITLFINNNIPKTYQKKIKTNIRELDTILASFLRGQFLISTILSIYYVISFYLIGIEYSILLGIFSGIFSLLPYFGIFISFIVAAYLTLLQFADFYYLFYLILVYLLSFLLEGYFLTPKIMGKKLGVHPLVILFSVFIFGSMLGIVGVFFSIPMASIIFLYYKKFLFNINNYKK
tara:strand:+ start:572 stop:1609 length:1038 start_codon:yes stop_codon:yes gene_type:complete